MSKCLTNILSDPNFEKALAEKKISAKTVEEFVDVMEQFKKARDEGMLTDAEYRQKMNNFIQERRNLNVKQAIIAKEELFKRAKLDRLALGESFRGRPDEAYMGLLSKTPFWGKKNSVSAEIEVRQKEYLNFLSTRIAQYGEDTEQVFLNTNGALDEEIINGMWDKAYGTNFAEKSPVEARNVAEVYYDFDRLMFKEKRDLNIPVNDLQGHLIRVKYSPAKAIEMGVEEFKKNMLPLIDMKKTFSDNGFDTPKKINDFLTEAYSSISRGTFGLEDVSKGKRVSDEFTGVGAQKGIADRLTEKRSIHFKGPKEFHTAMKTFGDGPISVQIYREAVGNARMLGIYSQLGTQPEATVLSSMQRVVKQLRRSGREAEAVRLEGKESAIMNVVKQITGTINDPENLTLASFDRALGNLEAVSKLANVGIRSFSNFAGQASVVRNSTGQNFLGSLIETAMESVANIPEGSRKVIFRDLGERFEDMVAAYVDTTNPFGVERGTSKLARHMNRFNGLAAVNEIGARGTSISLRKSWFRVADKPFEKVPANIRAWMLSSGVDASEWRAMAHMKSESGIVSPDLVSEVPDELVKDILNQKTSKIEKGRTVSQWKNDFRRRLEAGIIRDSKDSTTTPDAREMGAMMGSSQAGTPERTMRAMLMRFKSFTFQSVNVMRSIMNSGVDARALENGIARSQGNDLMGLGQFILTGTGLAFLAEHFIALGSGKPPPDPNDPNTWLKAASKSGAGGLYADFVTGEWDRYEFAGSLLGPTLGNLTPIAKAGALARKEVMGENETGFQSAGSEMTRVLRSYIPFQNAMLMKQALDYVQYDLIDGAINPDRQRRRELRELREELQR